MGVGMPVAVTASCGVDGGVLHDDVAGDDGGAAAVEVLADAGGVGSGGGEENEAAGGGAADLVGAVLLGEGEGGDSVGPG